MFRTGTPGKTGHLGRQNTPSLRQVFAEAGPLALGRRHRKCRGMRQSFPLSPAVAGIADSSFGGF
jgi:hypothetical protein